MPDTKLRALHFSTLLHEAGHDLAVEDSGGAGKLVDEEGTPLCDLSAAFLDLAESAGSQGAVLMLVQVDNVRRAAYADGRIMGHAAGRHEIIRITEELFGMGKIADAVTRLESTVAGLSKVGK